MYIQYGTICGATGQVPVRPSTAIILSFRQELPKAQKEREMVEYKEF
jgi:hypothetical protein